MDLLDVIDEDLWLLHHPENGGRGGISYSDFIPHLALAIQELSAKNEALERRLAALENRSIHR
jgi:hypothetical protein